MLKSAGFAGVSADSGRDYVAGTASVSTIETALSTRLLYYRPTAGINAGSYRLRANDRPVSMPTSVAASVLGVTGLENAAPVKTYVTPEVSVAPAAPPASRSRSPAHPGTPSTTRPAAQAVRHHRFPTVVCGYSADQLRAAYGYNRHNIGKGVTVALVEIGLTPDMFQTLQDYTGSTASSRRPRAGTPSSRSAVGSACGDEFDVEEQLDVESSYDMAPLANQLRHRR